MNIRDIVGAVFWLSVSVFVCVMSIKIGVGDFRAPGPGLFGFLSAILLGLLSIILALFGLAERTQRQGIIELWKGMRWGKVALLAVSLMAYPILLPLLGFVIDTFIVMVFLFRLTGIRKLSVSIGIGLLAAILGYIIFHVFLRVPLPRGILYFIPI
jgi:putative tricarboxylic transport membrane protein